MSKIVCIFGRRGGGKSTLARALVAPCRRLIVFNTLGEEGHNEIGYVCKTPGELYNYIVDKPQFRAVADFRNDEYFPWVVRLAMAVEDCTLMVDEIDRHCDPRSIPKPLDDCVRYGRHNGVSIVAISRRPASMPRIVTSQAEEFYVFRINEPKDVKYIADVVGDERFTELPQYEHIQYNI